jgi:hypothetical protein
MSERPPEEPHSTDLSNNTPRPGGIQRSEGCYDPERPEWCLPDVWEMMKRLDAALGNKGRVREPNWLAGRSLDPKHDSHFQIPLKDKE